jgi:hypothetical protein
MYVFPSVPHPAATLVDSSLWGPAATFAAAAITALCAVLVYAWRAAASAQDRKREMCARALADALAWLELPYRIRRRKGDSPDALAVLTAHVHRPQEQLLFHSAWLRIELPGAAPVYDTLLLSLKDLCEGPLRDAWRAPAPARPEQMNLGPLLPSPPADQIAAFCQAVRQNLTLLPWRRGP